MSSPKTPRQFTLLSRVLHWLMVVMVLSMLFIGVTMVSSLGNYSWLVAVHRPLGIAILITVIVRFVNRMLTKAPPLPPTVPPPEKLVAFASEVMLYLLMFSLPLVGWGMLSAAGNPIVMFGAVHLPPILPSSPKLYALLRRSHTVLAYLLFLTFLAHMSAVLFHTLVVRDRLIDRMAVWPIEKSDSTDNVHPAENA